MVSRIIINGAHGKMGRLASETIAKYKDFDIVAQLDRNDNLAKAIKETNAQIVLELTNANCVFANTETIIENNAHPVIGATGLNQQQVEVLQEKALRKKLGGIIVPNFSLGAILMMKFATIAAKFLKDVEIIEAHHPHKLDAPSGTAIRTAELISNIHKASNKESASKEIIDGARGATYQNINIHSIRLPGILANQQVIFGNDGETLSLVHTTIDRSCFMPGIVLACQKVKDLDKLYYGLENILEI